MKLAKERQAEQPYNNAILLSEAESCVLAGVTAATLNSYTEFGLLKPVIKNSKPFYRKLELSKLFNIKIIPTLDDLIEEEPETEKNKTEKNKANENSEIKFKAESKTTKTEKQTENKTKIQAKESNTETIKESNEDFLPAIKSESALLVNKELQTRVKSLEEERDWLRNRIEQLEQHSAREQMLLLREKETLREVLNSTLNKDQYKEQNKETKKESSLQGKGTAKLQIIDFIKSLSFFNNNKT